ncbi:MAG: VOC family protein [Clostridia bacterium]|nr:VOC family protein [Clostridia bacterium]MBR1686089.1 VOC family protein [Clostridia bacterium]
MIIGELCLETNDVNRLAAFCKALLEVDNGSEDPVHQTILADETISAVYNDGTDKKNDNRNISLAFTVENIASWFEKVKALGAEIIREPVTRPWGAVNMSFYDPDRNVIYLRNFPKKEQAAN